MAKNCDIKLANNLEECKGELFGIPITLKELTALKDTPSTVSCIDKLNRI